MADAPCLLLPLLLLVLPAQALTQDGLYLLDAKRALTVAVPPGGGDGAGAQALADWNPRDATPCNWTGVACDDTSTSRVTAISLPGLNLAGPFPAAALCRLPRLRSIDLSNNYIGPDLGGSIGRCRALARLDLSMNSFVGPLPDALADLPDLLYLNLASNNFTGAIPPSFARFPRLQSLSLVYNLLGGQVPPFLGAVATLRELNLSYNPFAPGPLRPQLGALSALRVFWLAGCGLVGAIPLSLARLVGTESGEARGGGGPRTGGFGARNSHARLAEGLRCARTEDPSEASPGRDGGVQPVGLCLLRLGERDMPVVS